MMPQDVEEKQDGWKHVDGGLYIELRTNFYNPLYHPHVNSSKSELISLDYSPASADETDFINKYIETHLPFMGRVRQAFWMDSPRRLVRLFADVLEYERAVDQVHVFVERLHADPAAQKLDENV